MLRATSAEIRHSRWLDALGGVFIGILAYTSITLCCSMSKKASARETGEGIDTMGLVRVRPVYFGGAFFRQFSWCPEADQGSDSMRILDVRGRQVAIVAGSILQNLDGEGAQSSDS